MEDFINAVIQNVSQDELFLILSKTDPKSVLSLCQTSQRFAALCRNEKLWKRLLKVHFPQFPETNTPRQQFQALANGIVTSYGFDLVLGGYIPPTIPPNFAISKANIINLEILGLPLPPGTRKWVAYQGHWNEENQDYLALMIKAFNTREEAVQALVTESLRYLNSLESLDEVYDIIDSTFHPPFTEYF